MGRGRRDTVRIDFRIDSDLRRELLENVPDLNKPFAPGQVAHGGWQRYFSNLARKDLRERKKRRQDHEAS